MAGKQKESWGWVVLFCALSASSIARLVLGGGHRFGLVLEAFGFALMAAAAWFRPQGLFSISWRQLSAPRKLGSRKLVGVFGVALIVIGTAMQWFKI